MGPQSFSNRKQWPHEVSPDVLALNGVLTACEEVTVCLHVGNLDGGQLIQIGLV